LLFGAYGSKASAAIFFTIVSAVFRGSLRSARNDDRLYSIFHTFLDCS